MSLWDRSTFWRHIRRNTVCTWTRH